MGWFHVLPNWGCTSAWEAVGGLRPDLRYTLDWDLLLRLLARYPAVLIDDFLSVSREHGETKTSRGRLERVGEIHRMVEGHTGREVTPGSLYYLLEALLQTDLPEELRAQVWSTMGVVRQGFRREWGNADGFPEHGDARDAVHVPSRGVTCARTGAALRERCRDLAVAFVQPGAVPPARSTACSGRATPARNLVSTGPTDASVDVLRVYADRLTLGLEPDRAAHALNKGFAAATGDVLGWLNSDDMLAEGALLRVGEAFAEDPDLDLVFANALYVDEEDRPYAADHGTHRTALYYGEAQPRSCVPAYWSYVHAIPQPTAFFRRRLVEACGGVDARYHFIFDFELFFRFMARARVRKIERTLAFYRIHASSKTADWEKFLVELYRFSRPQWPPVWTREFRSTWWDFLKHYPPRRFGRSPRDRRSWPSSRSSASRP
jgi:hypothetical protein